jgi:hypothetical protein
MASQVQTPLVLVASAATKSSLIKLLGSEQPSIQLIVMRFVVYMPQRHHIGLRLLENMPRLALVNSYCVNIEAMNSEHSKYRKIIFAPI